MNTFFKSLTAATVAVTIATVSLAAPAEAKVKGRDVAAGIALGVAAAVIVGGAVHHHARPVYRHGPPSYGPPRPRGCGWLKRKAHRTGSPYWWHRYERCRGW